MENTSKVLFSGNDEPQWFVSLGEISVGPIRASEVYERIMKGEVSWAHFIWKEGFAEWQRVCDVPDFQVAVPQAPAVKPKGQPPSPPKPEAPVKEWFVYFNDSQYGPFFQDEVLGMLKARKVDGSSFVWKDGMSDWQKISDVGFFTDSVPEPLPDAANKEKRKTVRRPLIARVMIVEGSKVHVGMCRDISVGGMQVLSSFVPEYSGIRLKLNISSPDVTQPAFEAFVAEGAVVRILDDRRGFSFRFENLSAHAKTIIERVIAHSPAS